MSSHSGEDSDNDLDMAREADKQDEQREKEEQERKDKAAEAEDKEEQSKGMDLTGFLFGNIDEEGKLSEDAGSFLDQDTRDKLGGLSSMLSLADIAQNDEDDEDEEGEDLGKIVKEGQGGKKEEDFDDTAKDPEAKDYSAIEEAMSDDSSSSDDSEEDVKDIELKETGNKTGPDQDGAKVEAKSETVEVKEEPKEDGPDSQGETDKAKAEEEESNVVKKENADQQLMPPPSSIPVAVKSSPAKAEKTSPAKDPAKIRKPLAGMLPETYKDVDVRELFPEFRPNSVLRFSRLFPIKASHRPRIWKNLRKKRRELSEEEIAQRRRIKEDGEFDWRFNYAELPEDPEAYEESGMVRLLKPKEVAGEEEGEQTEEEKRGAKHTDWRTGPAQYWYDMLGLPDKVEDYNYGLKCITDSLSEEMKLEEGGVKKEHQDSKAGVKDSSQSNGVPKMEFPPDAFLMVTQANWEEDVVWNGDDIRHKVLQKLGSKTNAAGWVPTGFNRTAGPVGKDGPQPTGDKNPVLVGPVTGKSGVHAIKPLTTQMKRPEGADDTFYSIFPVENEELAYGRWEDEVIWDAEQMPRKLKPKMVSLDPNDDNIILGIPDDIDPSTLPSDQPVKKVKIIQKHVKKSRMLLNRSGIISVVEEESPPPPPKLDNKDPFNISNDEHYLPKAQDNLIKVATGGTLLQHATPVVELRAPFVPTHIGPIKLRQFHRWPVKRFSHGPLAAFTQFHAVHPLLKNIRKKAKAREQEREAAGGGEIFFMRTAEDVSAKDGELVLFEFSEENPPLISMVGMASKVKNYYKRIPGKDSSKGADGQHRYGEVTLAHTSPFLGQMAPGQTIQTLENNLFRAPVYEHKVPPSDFLLIRTRNDYSIREADGLLVCGQQAPLYEVPGPNSKRANNFARDFLQVFIYRLFCRSRDSPKRIKMDEIKRAFPAHSESSIRKRLKPCAQFHRTGQDSNWWVIKPSFRLPTEEEMRAMVTPEQCCAFFSMIAAEQRLRDAGYGEKSLLAQQDDDDEESAAKLDDEVKCAPWNTTRAYILAMKGKCLLQLTGPADPTGPAGEGFSYIRIPNKPTNKEEQEQQPKRTVTGTDADLRKLPLKDARAILRKNGVPEDAIMKLSRWEVIDVVRTLSTEKVKAGEDGDHKFSRGNRFSIAEHQERYREDCQRIFEVQNKVLASEEILSSDEDDQTSEEEDANDEDLDEMAKNLENMLSNKKSSMQFLREREEAERKKLHKMIMGDDGDGDKSMDGSSQQQGQKRKNQDDEDVASGPPKVLRITRTFKNESGSLYTRTEIVRKPLVVETYVKVRETKDEAFIRQFATLDDNVKEEMKKEKRRIQEQLRRIKRNQEKERQQQEQLEQQAAIAAAKLAKKNARASSKKKPDLNLKCGACGAKGHMRTNKACPKFIGSEFDVLGPVNVAMTEKDEEELGREVLQLEEDEELVKADDTKISISSKLLKHTDEVRKRTMQLKVPKKVLKAAQLGGLASTSASGKKRRAGAAEHCDYLTKSNYRATKRRRTDPLVSLASFLESLHVELRQMNEAFLFLQPVNTKKVPDYLEKIKTPMDLQTIRENIQNKKYQSREDFLQDISLIVDNSATYNGDDDIVTKNAEKLRERVIEKFQEHDEMLIGYEKEINPLLDDNAQKGFTYAIKKILEDNIKTMQESWPFLKPVSRKNVKNYYELIKTPMTLEMMEKKVDRHQYHSRQEFLADFALIYTNSATYNGEDSEYTAKAKRIFDVASECLAQYDGQLSVFEDKIREVQQRMVEQAEMESLGASIGEESQPGFPLTTPPPKGKRKRGRPRKIPLTSEFVANSDDDDDDDKPKAKRKTKKSAEAMESEAAEIAFQESGEGNLADDLNFTSDEDDDADDADWEAVGDEDNNAGEVDDGLTVTIENVDQQNVVIEEGQIVDIGDMGYYGDLPADSSASALLFGGPGQAQESQEGQQNSNVIEGAAEAELQQVDESYDPTDFFSSIGKGGAEEQHHVEVMDVPEGAEVAATVEIPDIVNQPPEQAPAEQQQQPLQDQQPEAVEPGEIVDAPEAVTAESENRPVDIINDDLDISDSDEDDENNSSGLAPPPAQPSSSQTEAESSQEQQQQQQQPPPPPPDDDDGLYF